MPDGLTGSVKHTPRACWPRSSYARMAALSSMALRNFASRTSCCCSGTGESQQLVLHANLRTLYPGIFEDGKPSRCCSSCHSRDRLQNTLGYEHRTLFHLLDVRNHLEKGRSAWIYHWFHNLSFGKLADSDYLMYLCSVQEYGVLSIFFHTQSYKKHLTPATLLCYIMCWYTVI